MSTVPPPLPAKVHGPLAHDTGFFHCSAFDHRLDIPRNTNGGKESTFTTSPLHSLSDRSSPGQSSQILSSESSPSALPSSAPFSPIPSGNNEGSNNCGSIDDGCDRAYSNGILASFTFGQAGCTAICVCDVYGFGMTGSQIKDAVQYMEDNDGVKKCGSTYLSNSCHITLNYCTSCKSSNN